MHFGTHHLYVFDIMSVRVTFTLKLLIGTIIIISQNAFAQSALPVDTVNESKAIQIADNDEQLPVKEVEAGPGGNIKLERKYRTRVESLYEWHAHLLWESRYVTEGRDNLSGHSLASVSTEFSVDEFSVIPWVADSAAADYSEFNLNVIYGSRLTEDLILYAGYNYIHARLIDDRANDNEVSLDLTYKLKKHFNALASVYHSFDARGAFMEMAVKYNNAINKKLHYGVAGTLGLNGGYVTDGHKGLNHAQLRANVAYQPSIQTEIFAYTGYNMAINRDTEKYPGDESLGYFFWGGVGFTYLF